jgi:hypothetical protein
MLTWAVAYCCRVVEMEEWRWTTIFIVAIIADALILTNLAGVLSH